MLLDQLDPLVGQWEIIIATMVLMWFFTAVSGVICSIRRRSNIIQSIHFYFQCIIADKLCCPVENPENRDNDNQHTNSISEWIERHRLDFNLRGSYSTTNSATNYPITADYYNIPVPTTATVSPSQAQNSAHTYTVEVVPPPPSSKARSNTAPHTRNTTHNTTRYTTRYTTRNNSCNTMSEAHASVSTQTVSPQQILYPHRISSGPSGHRNHYYTPQPPPPPPPSVSPALFSDRSPSRPRLLSPQGSNKPPPPLSSPRAAAAANQSRSDSSEENNSIDSYL